MWSTGDHLRFLVLTKESSSYSSNNIHVEIIEYRSDVYINFSEQGIQLHKPSVVANADDTDSLSPLIDKLSELIVKPIINCSFQS